MAPDVEIYTIQSTKAKNELHRMAKLCFANTFIVPRVVKELQPKCLFHLSYNTGLKKLKVKEIVLPADIKAISHRTLGGRTIPFYKYFLYKAMYYWDFKKNDYIIAMCNFDQEQIKKYYAKFDSKIQLISIPVNIKMFERNPVEKPYITAINLQFYHKNIITLLKAFAQIKDEISHDLILVGKLHKRVDFLKDYVKNNHLQKRIKFTGFMEEDEMYQTLANSSLYVNPSLYEGFGMTAVESMVLKVPTLIANVTANYEVTKGRCFYYTPADDANELAKNIKHCLSNLPDENTLQAISELMIESYHYKGISNQYWEFFNNI